MAKQFEVPFLGCVPIDPAFVQLIEEGTRPVYPVGTEVGGVKFGTEEEGRAPEEEGLILAEKYRSCSLAPTFEGIVKSLILKAEGNAVTSA